MLLHQSLDRINGNQHKYDFNRSNLWNNQAYCHIVNYEFTG